MTMKILTATVPLGLALALGACSGSQNNSSTANSATDQANVEEMGPDGGGGGNITDNASAGTDGTGALNASGNDTGTMNGTTTSNSSGNSAGGSTGGGSGSGTGGSSTPGR